MASEGDATGVAVGLTLAAAFLWATYYIFVLAISPGTRPTAILVYPFLIGGIAYGIWAVATGDGRAFARVWTEPAAYLRTGLLVVMQVSVLAATYLTGPIDSSLLSLIGDVVATPIIVAYVLGAHRAEIRSTLFALGLLLSLAGGTLTIAGGQSLSAIPPVGWIVVPAVPLSVAFYFLLAARANERAPPSAVVGQSMLASGLVAGVLAPLIPGGWSGLVPSDPTAWYALAALGLTSFFAAPVLYFAAIHRVGLALPPMLMTGIPVFTLLLSGLILHLALPWLAVLGIPVAVAGGILALRGELSARAGSNAQQAGPTR
jgi:drug/metabolite transporter (DMT)-like permease